MAARRNSSRAPERPRSRMRSKRWWRFRWAKRVSTLFNPSEFKPGEAIASNPEEGDRDRREYGDVGGYAEV